MLQAKELDGQPHDDVRVTTNLSLLQLRVKTNVRRWIRTRAPHRTRGASDACSGGIRREATFKERSGRGERERQWQYTGGCNMYMWWLHCPRRRRLGDEWRHRRRRIVLATPTPRRRFPTHTRSGLSGVARQAER